VTKRPVDPVAAARGHLRASDADREQVIETLKVAFTRGRLTRDELDLRVGQALLARTYAELARANADLRARPAPAGPRPAGGAPARQGPGGTGHPVNWPPHTLTAPARRQRANHWSFTGALGLVTVVLPVMMVAALHDRSQDLFCASIVLLMAYVMALVVAAANVVAARFDDGGRQRSR
jgi:cytochrome bd-type quinol oxidase subunit 1